jgi:drug/metabolite transporter (DMT)-like permease
MLDYFQDILVRQWNDLVGRLDGPLTFRFVLQPSMALFMAIRDGLKDARAGRPPTFWAILTHPDHREDRLLDALKAMWRVLLFGLVMDVIYQFIVLRTFYPVEALIVVLVLAFLPYLLARGLVNRIMGRRHDRRSRPPTQPPKER